MARVMPDVAVASLEHGSERDLLRALKAGLPDHFLILHSYPWLQPDRDDPSGPVREGEADFLVLHPRLGVLVIEAKGGEIVLQDRVWKRRTALGLKVITDPAWQARRSLHALKNRVRALAGYEAASVPFASAVAFPHCAFRGEPPADLPRAAIITHDDLDDIRPAIERCYATAPPPSRPLSPAAFEQLRKAVAPEFRLYEPLRLGVGGELEGLDRLTRQQLEVLQSFEGPQRVVVRGVAGSGKTLLAVARARGFAEAGMRTLLTCYNAELADWVGETTRDEGAPDTLTVINFHRLAADLCRRAQLKFAPPPGDAATWWDEDAPDLMVQAAMALDDGGGLFDAVVVDEAQDFHPSWWDALYFLQGGRSDAPIWAFWDKDQSLRREPCDPPIVGAQNFNLSTNCRNTRRIVVAANTASQVESRTYDHAPLGRPPEVVVAPRPDALAAAVGGQVAELMREGRLRPNQIALIGPAAWRNGPLAQIDALAGVRLTDRAAHWRAGEGLLCTTARRFKGLESDAVLLYDFSGLGKLFSASDLYVVLTRARAHLVVVCRDRAARLLLDPAIEAARALSAAP